MRTFGCFELGERSFYAEVIGEELHVLQRPFWLDTAVTGKKVPLSTARIAVPVAPSKLIAVGLNYADHVAEMKRTPLGTPLIWFKAPSSLLAHEGEIKIAFPEHKTDFEVELALVIGQTTKNISAERALEAVFGYTVGEDISDRDLQNSEKQFARCKSFDTYSPLGPFVYSE
ncbi:MAG: fumarylacetoacetate hydrolase family protein, partial [Verrucomicrobiota bacterium]